MKSLRLIALAFLLAAPLALAEQPLPVYPGHVHTRIGGDLAVGGRLHRMAYFTTADSMEKVAGYFEKLWKEEGYPTFVDGDLEDEGVVSSFMTREGVQRSVVLRRHGEVTLVFTVLKDVWIKVGAQSQQAPLLPAEVTLFSDESGADDGHGRTRQRTQVVEGDLGKWQQEVAQRMKLRGYQLVRESGQKATASDKSERIVYEHARPGQQVITVLTGSPNGLVVVNQTWIGSDRADAIPNDLALEDLRRQMKKEKQK